MKNFDQWQMARKVTARLALLIACYALGLLAGSACNAGSACPPAQLANINAHYVAAVASACKGTPRKKCDAAKQIDAERIAQEKDAGCL